MSVDLSVIGVKSEPRTIDYNVKDVILYALGVGASTGELPYIYENSPGGIQVLPSFCVIPASMAWPRLGDNIDFSRFLHGGQSFKLHKPLAPEGRVVCQGEVTGIWDKGKGAVYDIVVTGRSEKGEPLFETVFTNFYLGEGGFGGERGPRVDPVVPPRGAAPDYSIPYTVAPNQAAIYRLSGDMNPLHLDPEFARGGGFNQPILHGLCTYGITVRCLTNVVLGGDVTRMTSFSARMSSPVLMDETIVIEAWKDGDKRLIVQVRGPGSIVLSDCVAEIH